MTTATKITYTSASGDLEEFHRRFDAALVRVRSEAGRSHACHIAGEPVETRREPLEDRSPIDTGLLLARFASAGPAEVDRAVTAARRAQRARAALSWADRVAILRCRPRAP